jgi:toxin ParE1/3/4
MKAGYNVSWSETAEKDLLGVIEFIAADSPSRAYDIFKDIKKKASSLRSFPERGRMVPEFQDQGITLYHELIIGPWRIIYRIAEKQVYVLSVLDSRRSIEDILLRRLIDLKL